MSAFRLEKESIVEAPPSVVFARHEAPGFFEALQPPWEKVRMEDNDPRLFVGRIMTISIQPVPIVTLRWVAEIVEYNPPHRFADRQVSGPFGSWFHQHEFLEHAGGSQTRMRDVVEYDLPLGWLGRLVAARFVEKKLRRIFDYRHNALRRLLVSS